MTSCAPPISVDTTFTVKGGLFLRAAKVPLDFIEVDDVKHPIFKIRKRDYWLFGGFVPKHVTPVIKENVAGAIKLLQKKFRDSVIQMRKDRVEEVHAAEIAELQIADSGRQELGLSSSDSESDSPLPSGPDTEDEDDEGPATPRAAARMKSKMKAKFTEIEVEDKKFEIAENCHLNGIPVKATAQSIEDILIVFHKTITGLSEEEAKTSGVMGQGSKKLSWKQKAMAQRGVEEVEEGGAADSEADDFNIRGIVGWRNSDKSFMIWYKKPDGSRCQSQKGLQVKTTKKVGGQDVPLKRAEFLQEKRKVYKMAMKLWNESDCSKRARLSMDH